MRKNSSNHKLNKHSAKKTVIRLMAGFLAAFFMASAPAEAATIASNAGVATESLNNKQTEEGQLITTISGADATTNLKVKLTASGQKVEIYKIAGYAYDETNGYAGPTWTTEVTNWILATDAYTVSATGTGKSIKTAYQSPANLSSASSATWDEFYNNLLYNENSTDGPLNVIEYGTDVTGSLDDSARTGKLTKVATLTGGSDLSVTFENLNIGMYAVMVTGAKKYKPVIAELSPKSTGPDHAYYIEKEIEVELKSSDATIEKKINGKDADAVSIGEKVKFTVTTSLPSLYQDRVVLNNADGNPYKLYVEDLQSKAFAFYDSDSSGEIDAKDFSIAFTNNDTSYTLTSGNVIYYEIANETYDKTGLSEGTGYVKLDSDAKVASYTYDYSTLAAMYSALGTPATGSYYYAIKQEKPAYTVTSTTKKDSNDETASDLKLSFNVGALKKMTKDGNLNVEATQFVITYYATVTKDIEIASEKNYNTATLVYENGTQSDTVKGYTYGLQVIKIDGDTAGTSSEKYIAGAQFNLYKETSTYIKKSGETTFNWVADMDGDETDPLAEDANYSNYAKIKAKFDSLGSGADYYCYEEEAKSAGTTDSGASYAAGDTIARVFKVFTNGYIDDSTTYTGKNFISTNTADGITIKGLDEGNYVLMEAKAPVGYNELSEDILFSVKLLEGDEFALENQGSYAKFKDQSDTLIENGITSLRVLNYKGLTLPSTGGKGILLFIMIGCGLMVMAVVMVLMMRRRDASYYM